MNRNIQKYNDFINESLLLEANMVYDPEFVNILGDVDSVIAQIILSLSKKDVDVNTNYISIDDEKPDYILFAPDNKVNKLNPYVKSGYNSYSNLAKYAKENGYPIHNIDLPNTGQQVEEVKVLDDNDLDILKNSQNLPYNSKGNISHIRFIKNVGGVDKEFEIFYPTKDLIRDPSTITKNPYKIGRFANNLLTKAGVEFNQTEIEDFVSKFKAQVLKKRNMLDNFDIVTGEDIRKYYLADNYSDRYGGTLGNSCMKGHECQPYFDIYVVNASLIILRNPEEKEEIIGRALLWDAVQDSTKNEIRFMDRIYVTDHSHTELFKEFAVKNGFYYKVNQDYNPQPLMFNNISLSSRDSMITVHLQPNLEYSKYPFIDTVCYYNTSSETLSNDENSSYDYELTTTNGRSAYCEYCEDGVIECGSCDGDGYNYCSDCDSGEGNIECPDCNGDDEDCTTCNGEGSIECESCGGSGRDECERCEGDGNYPCPYCDE